MVNVFNKIYNYFTNKNNETAPFTDDITQQAVHVINDLHKLVKAQQFNIIMLQELNDDFAVAISALLLENGKEDYVINSDFIESFLQQRVAVRHEYESNGNLKIWTELKDENEL